MLQGPKGAANDPAEATALPIPDDLPDSAPIINDVEKGYSNVGTNGQYDENEPESSRAASQRGHQRDQGENGASDAKGKGRGKKSSGGHGKGLTEGDQDMDDIPKNNLLIVMPAIGLCLFLSALDQSIVATALPTIAEELHATPSEYQWVGTAYTLAMTLQTPINGRVSDIIGRKPVVYSAIVLFFIFSALCGAAKSMTWLIVARAFQGLGGGCILGMANILVADVTPLDKRPLYQGYIGGTWGIASVLGPILGGLLTEKASWRWSFYINLPTCGVSLLLLIFKLKLNPTKKYTFAQLRDTFDFLGLALLMIGGSLLIVGFARAADFGFSTPSAYGVIIAGAVVTIASIVNCLITKRNAIIPARMFKIRTTLFFLIASMLQALAFLPSNYLLPQLFQGVRGSDALSSGIQFIPYAVTVSLSTVVAGQINSRLRIIRPVAWFGYGLAAIGFALFYKILRWPFGLGVQLGLQVIAGVGIGLSLTTPMLILQAAMPMKEMAAATSAWTLTRSLGGSIGLAVFTAVLNTDLRSRFKKIPGYGTEFQVPESASGYRQLHDLSDPTTKEAVLKAFSESLGLCWIIDVGFLLACLAMTLWTRSYSLNRSRGGPRPPASSEQPLESEEKAEGENDSTENVLRGQSEAPSALDITSGSSDGERSRGVFDLDAHHRDTPQSEKTVVETPWKDDAKSR